MFIKCPLCGKILGVPEGSTTASCPHCRIFWCIPPGPVTLDPRWLSATVKHLAQAIDAEKAFDRLPILADALEDAGCTNHEILAHCRGGDKNVRHKDKRLYCCWVLDLLGERMRPEAEERQ